MHKHQWSETPISNGTKNKKAKQMSDGAICEGCKLTAKAPSGQVKGWLKSLPKS